MRWSPLPYRVGVGFGVVVMGCAAARAPKPADLPREAPAAAPADPLPWATQTEGPAPAPVRDLPWLACVRDPGLERVAEHLAAEAAQGKKIPNARVLERTLRRFGSPLPAPQASVLSGKNLRDDALRARIRLVSTARCGVRDLPGRDGERTVVLVAAEAHASLSPLPSRARVGQFLTLRATPEPGVRSVRVYLTGPSGNVHTTPVSTDATGSFVARFAAEAPGVLTAQVVADLPDGPRPILEALVFADAEPRWDETEEAAARRVAQDETLLYDWLAEARRGKDVLSRDGRLEAIAKAHAERMRSRRIAAHDAGDGLPSDRVAELGVRDVGENVAHARSLWEAHEALLESPSHRANVLSGRFTRVGIGVARDADGSVWVTQLFTSTAEGR